MSRKRKVTTEPVRPTSSDEVVSYKVFFQGCIIRGIVKANQEREIHAFFKDLGLTDKESPDVYKDALAKY